MEKDFKATSPITGRQSNIQLLNIESMTSKGIENRNFGKGLLKEKSRRRFFLLRLFERKRSREIDFVIRVNRPEDSRRIVENWVNFKQEGFPVPNTLRVIDKTTILITNVKRDGSETYGKSTADKTALSENRKDIFKKVDFIFVNNYLQWRDHVLAEAQKLAIKATKLGFQLPWDDAFELLVHPNETWELIILDLSRALSSREMFTDIQWSFLEKENNKFVNKYIDKIDRSHSLLKEMMGV